MLQRKAHVILGFVCVALLGIQSAVAVSFERIDVASHMGEPFYAEVPLRLDGNESLSKISVELGEASDYRILEVYRDQAIDKIRTDIVKDERGSRVKLSSESPIDTAFFNVVLKVRYGRSTHYKKMPIFLESASADTMQDVEQPNVVAAAPVNAATVKPETSDAFVTKVPLGAKAAFEEPVEDDMVEKKTVATLEAPKAFGDWARTSRYGPMVYGDTITTVAQRLRLDDTFTNQQVMVALYERNKAKFGRENINLIKAGTYLDVPTASEVRRVSPAQAKQTLAQQNKVWKNLMKQPKYAAVADAQRTRYSSRVRVGAKATGVASAPMAMPDSAKHDAKAEAVVKADAKSHAKTDINNTVNAQQNMQQPALLAAQAELAKKDKTLSALQEKMASLESKLAAAEKKPAAAVNVDSAALDSKNKRLEIVIARLQNQLETAKANVGSGEGDSGWMMYALAGLGVILLGLIGAIVMLLRRKPSHPAEQFVDAEDNAAFAVADEVDETIEQRGDETAFMDAGDFEMPSEAEASDNTELFGEGDEPLEEIPDFTDDETGEMDAFDTESDETPDPSVNYLEEADVYLRYGMEDEAEKQAKMAIKLDENDPAAHAKLVQVLKAKGDDAAAINTVIEIAKKVLVGASLTAFEGLLAGADEQADAPDGETDPSVNDNLQQANFAGDDTGMVDFGEIGFGNEEEPKEAATELKKDIMEPDLLDTGEMDFGEVVDDVEQEAGLESSGDIDFTGIDFSALDEAEDGDDDLLGGIEETKIEDAETEDVMDDGELDTGELDFGALDMGVADEADDSIDAALDFSDLSLDDDVTDSSGMEESALDTGELDFGELDGSDFNDNNGKSEADVMEDGALDTGAIDFGDVSMPDDKSDNVSDVESDASIDFDFSDIADDSADETGNTSDVTSEQLLTNDLGDSIDLDNIDFGDLDSLNANFSDADMDDTSAVAVDDATIMVSSGEQGEVSLEDLNDREIEMAENEAEAEANAVSVEVTEDADDPFASAHDLLNEAEDDSLSIELTNDDLGLLLGEGEDFLDLEDKVPTSNEEAALVGLEDESKESIAVNLSEPELNQEESNLDELGIEDFDLDDLDLDSLLTGEVSAMNVDASDNGEDKSKTASIGDNNLDATFIMDTTKAAVETLDAYDSSSLSDLDMDFSDDTFIMASPEDKDDTMDEFSATSEIEAIDELLTGTADDDLGSELDGLMDDLKGLLDEDEPKK